MAMTYRGVERDRLATVDERDAFYNVRMKKYGDTWKVAVWDTHIFNPDRVEKHQYPAPERVRQNVEPWEQVMLQLWGPRTDNINRAKGRVYDIAWANTWQYFATCTLDGNKCDRYDVDGLRQHLRGWLGNRVQRDGLRYLGVPERHRDGALHLHFLVAADRLNLCSSGTVVVRERKKPVKLATAKRAGYEVLKPVYNWPDWPLGYSTCVPVDANAPGVAAYMAKYITKGQEKIFGKRYLAGGKILRDVPMKYARWEYDAVDGQEYTPIPGRRVKYLTLEGMSER